MEIDSISLQVLDCIRFLHIRSRSLHKSSRDDIYMFLYTREIENKMKKDDISMQLCVKMQYNLCCIIIYSQKEMKESEWNF